MNETCFRWVDPACLELELHRIQCLNQQVGTPLIDGHLRRIASDGWLTRNPEIYHLYEKRGKLRGYVGLVPITPASYQEFLAGTRFPFHDLCPADILSPPEYAQARISGVYVWLEAFCYRDHATARELGEFIFAYLSALHLKGLLVATSRPEDEENCRWWGLVERYQRGPCPSGVRRLWYADEAVVCSGPHPLGRPVPIRGLFLNVQARFAAAGVLRLSPVQRTVARLFYLEEKTDGEIARILGVQPGTVKTHLNRIREKAEPVVGSTLSRSIAAWLHAHPMEVAAASE